MNLGRVPDIISISHDYTMTYGLEAAGVEPLRTLTVNNLAENQSVKTVRSAQNLGVEVHNSTQNAALIVSAFHPSSEDRNTSTMTFWRLDGNPGTCARSF